MTDGPAPSEEGNASPGLGVDRVIGWSTVAVLLAVLPALWGLMIGLSVLVADEPLDNLADLLATVSLVATAPAVVALVLVVAAVRAWRRARKVQGVERPRAPGAGLALVVAAALAAVPWLVLLLVLGS